MGSMSIIGSSKIGHKGVKRGDVDGLPKRPGPVSLMDSGELVGARCSGNHGSCTALKSLSDRP